MAGLKEFAERIKSDAAFKAKFAGIDSEDKLLSTARAEGYDLEQLDDEDLDMIAAGCMTWDLKPSSTNAVDQIGKIIFYVKLFIKAI